MQYSIQYLPIARKDIQEIAFYISDQLQAPKAALDFLTKLEDAICLLETFPMANPVYQPIKQLDFEYRMLVVKNYAVFYVILGDVVEIHRVVYAKMDLPQLSQ